MSEVPDKVIEQATRAAFMAGDDQEQYVHGFAPDDFEPWRWSSSELMSPSEATVAAAAPVIAAWARDQERDRIMQQVHSRLQTMGGETDFVSQADHNAREDELETLLAVLGWDGAK